MAKELDNVTPIESVVEEEAPSLQVEREEGEFTQVDTLPDTSPPDDVDGNETVLGTKYREFKNLSVSAQGSLNAGKRGFEDTSPGTFIGVGKARLDGEVQVGSSAPLDKILDRSMMKLVAASGSIPGEALIQAYQQTHYATEAAKFICNGNAHAVTVLTNESSKAPVSLSQYGATSTNFYRFLVLDFGSSLLEIWGANNANPNGTVSSFAGSICLSSNGNVYKNTGGTSWTAL